MGRSIEFEKAETDLVIAALVSMSCPLCPIHHDRCCGTDPLCQRLAERVAGGELSEIFGQGGE